MEKNTSTVNQTDPSIASKRVSPHLSDLSGTCVGMGGSVRERLMRDRRAGRCVRLYKDRIAAAFWS